jgi:hypothetical protein
MATPLIQTPYEAERLWANSYQGKRARLCLANNTGTLTASSTTAQWDAVELTGNGYARYEWTIPAGAYNTTSERFQAPAQLCEFQASSGGTGLNWNTAYLVVGTISGSATTWNTGVSFILNESPTVALYPGEPRGYNILLFTDGFLVTS